MVILKAEHIDEDVAEVHLQLTKLEMAHMEMYLAMTYGWSQRKGQVLALPHEAQVEAMSWVDGTHQWLQAREAEAREAAKT